MKQTALILSLYLLCFAHASAQLNVFDELGKPDETTGAKVAVHQDIAISNLVLSRIGNALSSTENYLPRGWKVQVFSNNSQSAKDEAFKLENKIKESFPNIYVRAERHSPFWKVRVGQFATTEEANEFKLLLLEKFPELKPTMYLVPFNNEK